MLSRPLRACYKALLRQIWELERTPLAFKLQTPLDKHAWLRQGGGHGWAKVGSEHRAQTARLLLPWLAETLQGIETLTASSLRTLVRDQFRQPLPPDAEPNDLDRAIQGIRVLSDQIHLARGSSSATTRGVQVEVTADFVGHEDDIQTLQIIEEGEDEEEEEEAGGSKLFYTYRVRVANVGTETVQLLGRHWIIQDSRGVTVTEVPRGTRGVIGCTPIIKPGTCFQYYSGTDLDEAPGSMHGSFQMAVLDDRSQPLESFDAEVAPFHFWPPSAPA
ncbi:hypothetical protein ACKKBG_A37230 [Auxenochlorella protothecoides x Auxenochlorella symbiontica]